MRETASSQRVGFFLNGWLALGLLLLLVSCATSPSVISRKGEVVDQVDFSDAPAMQAYAEHARQFCDEYYPKVCAQLAWPGVTFPRHVEVHFKRKLKTNLGEARITDIWIDSSYSNLFATNILSLDQLLVHELTHVAQHYRRRWLGGLFYQYPSYPAYWEEGMADYVCAKLGQSALKDCTKCGIIYPDYRDGYTCASAFLLYLDQKYDSNLVRELNFAIIKDHYSTNFFKVHTGKELPALWTEFKTTDAFTANARRMEALREELGYVANQPPKDLEKRIDAYLKVHASKETLNLMHGGRLFDLKRETNERLILYLYFTQPGGSPEEKMMTLKEQDQLPGFAKNEHGDLQSYLTTDHLDATFPALRTFTVTKKGEKSFYHYDLFRADQQSAWVLQRAWRTDKSGQVEKEFPVGNATK